VQQGGGQVVPGYAEPGGGIHGLGDDQPLINPDDNYTIAGPAVARAQYPKKWGNVLKLDRPQPRKKAWFLGDTVSFGG
jgi:hypothetical protein